MIGTRATAASVVIVLVAVAGPLEAGHESSFYPSYYPQEIRVESVDPSSAATLLRRASIHAFIGTDALEGGPLPGGAAAVDSLGSYVVVTLNPASGRLGDPAKRCAVVRRLAAGLARERGKFIFDPYPVTPYHMDYLDQFDLAASAKQRVLDRRGNEEEAAAADLRVDGSGPLTEALVGGRRPSGGTGWDARVETIDVSALIAAHATETAGRLGPPFRKAGWYDAYLLMADRVKDRSTRDEIDRIYHRLLRGAYGSEEEKVTLERSIVSLLARGCERAVVGYTLRRELFNVDYSAGIENIAYDSLDGLNSPIFLRTVKLKDFPWNGWLRIGVAGKPVAAWNPIAGFTDPFGRLVWAAVGDPGLLPDPYAAGWIHNRVTFRRVQDTGWLASLLRMLRGRAGSTEGVAVPSDALMPRPGSGALEPVGRGTWAAEQLEYRVLASSFHDGTHMTVADVLYPYVFAYRWGAAAAGTAGAADPFVARATALMRDRLVGVKVLRTEAVVRNLGGDLQLRYTVPVLAVYVNDVPADPQYAASIALPWSTAPWHVIALMEEAAKRGLGAFSAEAAARRGVAWLDLVRDPRVTAGIARVLDELESRKYVPEALRGLVTAADAQRRWEALRQFYRTTGHFLVTNGPYRLKAWTGSAAVLEVFRDLSYPLGVGSFDTYAWPRKAYIASVSQQGSRVEVQADIERLMKYGRAFKIIRERLGSNTSGAIDPVSPVCRMVMVDAAGRVVKVATTAVYGPAGTFSVDLPASMPAGSYAILVSVYLNGNYMTPDVKLVPYRVN